MPALARKVMSQPPRSDSRKTAQSSGSRGSRLAPVRTSASTATGNETTIRSGMAARFSTA